MYNFYFYTGAIEGLRIGYISVDIVEGLAQEILNHFKISISLILELYLLLKNERFY